MTKKRKQKPIEEQPVKPIREEMKSLYMLRGVPDGFWVNASEDFNSLVCMKTLPAAVKAAVTLARFWKIPCEPVRIWLKDDTPPKAIPKMERQYLPQQQKLFAEEQE